jgi:hypothetical protein
MAMRAENERGAASGGHEEALNGADAVDGGNSPIDGKLLVDNKTSKVVRKLIKLYRQSICFDTNGFKKWLNQEGGDTWDFVSNNFLAKGVKKFADAVEICNEMTRMGTLNWTWQEHLNQLQELDTRGYHKVSKSTKFLWQFCNAHGLDIWEITDELIDILDKRRSKVNTFLLMGKSNSGKTMFIKSVFEAFKARAIVTNGASVGFSWQDCIDCRVILNEDCIIATT